MFVGQRVELAPHRVGPLLLARRDEGSTDVAVLHQALPVGDPAGPGEALGGRDPRLGHPHHHVGLGRRLDRQQLAHATADLVDLPAVEPAVRPGDVGELEDAQAWLHVRSHGISRLVGPSASITTISPGATSRTNVAPMTLSAGVSEASTHPSGSSAGPSRPRHSGRNPYGIAHSEQPLGAHENERERALQNGQHRLHCGGQVLGLGKGLHQQLGHHIAVGGDGARQHAGLLGQRRRVGQVAVVPQREAGAAHRPVDGLRPGPVRGAVRRVAGVADGHMPLEPREGALVEDGGDQAHVLDDRDRVAVATAMPADSWPRCCRANRPSNVRLATLIPGA